MEEYSQISSNNVIVAVVVVVVVVMTYADITLIATIHVELWCRVGRNANGNLMSM
jgi:hypothetical protein